MGSNSYLFEGDTEFNHYSVADTNYYGRPARVLYSGNNDAAQSGIAWDDKDELLFDYNQRFLELIRGVRPRSVLILGGGAFTLPAALMAEFPELYIDVVELDGGLLDIARQYFDFKPSEWAEVHIMDARDFLAVSDQKFDLILVDVFLHATIPDSFQTLAAVQDMKQRLTKHGVLAMNIIAALDGRRSLVLRRMHELMQATFLDVRIFPATHGLSSWTPQNFVLMAQNGSRDLASFVRYAPVALNRKVDG